MINYKTDDESPAHFYDFFFKESNQNDARQKLLAYAKNTAIEWPGVFTTPGNYFDEFYPGNLLRFVYS